MSSTQPNKFRQPGSNGAEQLAIATDLLDFCGGDLSQDETSKFWRARSKEYNLTKEDQRAVFLTAYSLTPAYSQLNYDSSRNR